MARRNYGFRPTEACGNPRKVSLSDLCQLGNGNEGAGRKVLLYKLFEQAVGHRTITRNQGSGSDCVGQATARAVDVLQGVQIAGLGQPYQFKAMACASSIYGLSRVEIAAKRHGHRMRGAGSFVPYAAEAVRDYGCLYMMDYPDQGYDLREHSWSRSKEWGSRGLPDEMEPVARLHGIRAYAPVKNWIELRAAIANGYPVIIGSNVGFKGQKRRGGFLKPRGSWPHAMVYTAVDDESSTPGACCENSWGDWVGGDEYLEQPDGSFWVDPDHVDYHLRVGEGIAVSGHNGFEIQNVPDYVLL